MNLSWSCATCKYTKPTLLRLDESINTIKITNEERLTKLEKSMESVDNKISKKWEENSKQLKENLIKEYKHDMISEIDRGLKNTTTEETEV